MQHSLTTSGMRERVMKPSKRARRCSIKPTPSVRHPKSSVVDIGELLVKLRFVVFLTVVAVKEPRSSRGLYQVSQTAARRISLEL